MAEQTLLLQQTDKFTQQYLLSEIFQDDLESVFSLNVYDKEIQIWGNTFENLNDFCSRCNYF